MGVSLIAMRCRTSDRYRGAPRGVEVLAPLIAEALGLEPRFITAELTLADTVPAMASLKELAAESLAAAEREVDALWVAVA